jgi:hypothetical protein
MSEWRRLLRSSTTQARAVLQRILAGRIVCTPRADGQGYDFSAPTRFAGLFEGIVVTSLAPGDDGRDIIEHAGQGTQGIGPEDTNEADYDKVLERATEALAKAQRAKKGKRVTSPEGFEPSFQP